MKSNDFLKASIYSAIFTNVTDNLMAVYAKHISECKLIYYFVFKHGVSEEDKEGIAYATTEIYADFESTYELDFILQTQHEPLPSDFEKIWDVLIDTYPRKDNN